MDELINKQEVVDLLMERASSLRGIPGDLGGACSGAAKLIMQMPPAEPQIIRCKNCKHWIPYDWMFSEVWQSKNIADYPEDEIGCAWSDMAMKANDFCSRAERRTE